MAPPKKGDLTDEEKELVHAIAEGKVCALRDFQSNYMQL